MPAQKKTAPKRAPRQSKAKNQAARNGRGNGKVKSQAKPLTESERLRRIRDLKPFDKPKTESERLRLIDEFPNKYAGLMKTSSEDYAREKRQSNE